MQYPQIYIGQTPSIPQQRRELRTRALELQASLRGARVPGPIYVLLHFEVGVAELAHPAELLIICPHVLIVGAIREYRGPIEALPGGEWIRRANGAPLREQHGQMPLAYVREQRDAVRERLDAAASRILEAPHSERPFTRAIGALICAPASDPASRIILDIEDHLQLLKVLGLDELAGLVAMARSNIHLSEDAMRAIVGPIFGGRLWHDGARFLFELAVCRFRLHLLADDAREVAILPLIEGENVVGRRRAARHAEHRLTLVGDDLVSSDHALIVCERDDLVILRDMSKNGTWVMPPGGHEQHVQGGERAVVPGTVLRMGVTRLRLERADNADRP